MDFYVNFAWRDDRFLSRVNEVSFAWDPSWWMPAPELMNPVTISQDIQYPNNQGWVFSAQQGVYDWVDSPQASAEPSGAVWVMGAVRVAATLAVRVDVMDAEGVSVRVGVAEQPRLAAKSAAARTLDADRTVHAGLLPLLRTRAVV